VATGFSHPLRTHGIPQRGIMPWLPAGGRFQNAPDTKQEQDVAENLDPGTPLLMLLRQKGSKEQGWNDCPFWWPVLQAPRNTKTVIFASEMND